MRSVRHTQSGHDGARSVMWAMRPSGLMADPVLDGAQVEYAHEPVVSGGQVAVEELPQRVAVE